MNLFIRYPITLQTSAKPLPSSLKQKISQAGKTEELSCNMLGGPGKKTLPSANKEIEQCCNSEQHSNLKNCSTIVVQKSLYYDYRERTTIFNLLFFPKVKIFNSLNAVNF